MSNILEINKLNKSYIIDNQEIDILINLDVAIEKGEFVSIIGPSGCGKSTLLKLITTLESKTSGSIKINGIEDQNPNPDVSMIFQESRLMPWLTVEKNIDFVIPKTVPKLERKQLVDNVINLVGLTYFKKALPSQLSGGMQQRVSIARGLVTNPKLLLLDEPFGALDAFTRMNMQQELLKIWKANNSTMILVTHDIDEAIFLSTRIFVMSERPGRIKEVIKVNLEGQRDRSSPEFLDIRRKILKSLFGDNDSQLEYII